MNMCPRGSEPHSPVADDSMLKKMAREKGQAEELHNCTLMTQAAHCTEHTLHIGQQ